MARLLTSPTLLWVCADCTLTDNGYDAHELGYTPEREPWSIDYNEPHELTMGRIDHEPWCERESDEDECGCDHIEFTRTPCDGCGTQLAGERYAYTLWTA